jgi:hypothetical protein
VPVSAGRDDTNCVIHSSFLVALESFLVHVCAAVQFGKLLGEFPISKIEPVYFTKAQDRGVFMRVPDKVKIRATRTHQRLQQAFSPNAARPVSDGLQQEYHRSCYLYCYGKRTDQRDKAGDSHEAEEQGKQ